MIGNSFEELAQEGANHSRHKVQVKSVWISRPLTLRDSPPLVPAPVLRHGGTLLLPRKRHSCPGMADVVDRRHSVSVGRSARGHGRSTPNTNTNRMVATAWFCRVPPPSPGGLDRRSAGPGLTRPKPPFSMQSWSDLTRVDLIKRTIRQTAIQAMPGPAVHLWPLAYPSAAGHDGATELPPPVRHTPIYSSRPGDQSVVNIDTSP